MRNKHAGECYRCGQPVEPGTGHFERASRARQRVLGKPVVSAAPIWLVQHAECARKHRGAHYSIWNRKGADNANT